MRSSTTVFGLLAAGTLLVGGAVHAAPPAAQQPDEQAAEVFKTTCTRCHTPDRILSARKTRTQWEETLDKMTKLGATASDEDWTTVLGYLMRHAGKVNVNRAPAKDIALVLDISAADADAIVNFRKANGDFADYDALAKVPGINVEKLEKSKDAIAF